MSLRFKIAASLALLLLVFAALMVYIADRQTTAFARQTLEKQTRGQLEVLAQVGRESVAFDDRAGLQALLEGASVNSDLLFLEIKRVDNPDEALAVWVRDGYITETGRAQTLSLETTIGPADEPVA
ncbi:MAG: hypothetical protein AAF658_16960, partial [Myxococcota bacterium]